MMDMTRLPVICTKLIGRQQPYGLLMRLVASACNGHGQVAVIAGESGIGKSRLVTEVLARWEAVQLRKPAQTAPLILRGRCFEPDLAIPYAPLLDLLSAHFATSTPEQLAANLGTRAPAFAKLFPELANVLPELNSHLVDEPEQEKRHLFHMLIAYFLGLAKTQPLLLLVEDTHWSDEASLEFLLYLTHRIAPHPILLLCTYSSEEVRSDFSRFLTQLNRERITREVQLVPLSKDEVAEMMRTIFAQSHPVSAEFLETIFGLTEGNPFFIEEVLKSLVASDVAFAPGDQWLHVPLHKLHLPHSVQIAVLRRFDQLSQEAKDLLALAAVIGRSFPFALLQQVTRQSEHKVVALMKELIAAQLVVEESEETFAFRHALTRQAIYNGLLARERKALHRTMAQAIEQVYTQELENHVADLAYHYYMASEWEQVLHYAQRAGERARKLYALRVALEHTTHLVEAAQHLAIESLSALYRDRAQIYETLGEFELAQHDYEQALTCASQRQDHQEEWRYLLDLGNLWTGRDYIRAGDYFHQALALARTMRDAFTVVQSLNRLGNWYTNIEEPTEGLRHHKEALVIFQLLEDEQGIAETLDLLGMTHYVRGSMAEGMRYFAQAVTLFRTLDIPQGLLRALAALGTGNAHYLFMMAVLTPSDDTENTRLLDEALTIARRIGWRAGEVNALIYSGFSLGPHGKLARALELAQRGLRIAEDIKHQVWISTAHTLLGALYYDACILDSAQHHFEHALTMAKDIGALTMIDANSGFLASTYIAQQDLSSAEAVLSSVCTHPIHMQTQMQRQAWYAQAELELAHNNPIQSLKISERMIAEVTQGKDNTGVVPRLWHIHAQALIALDRVVEGEAKLLAAIETARQLGLRPLLWRLYITLGLLQRELRQLKRARETFQQARTLIEELAATLTKEQIREQFLRNALAQLPRPAELSPRQKTKQAFGGLTGRERNVAYWISQGKTNQEIAKILIMSERTVGTHVGHIFDKLGFSRRAQIAAWAKEVGLMQEHV